MTNRYLDNQGFLKPPFTKIPTSKLHIYSLYIFMVLCNFIIFFFLGYSRMAGRKKPKKKYRRVEASEYLHFKKPSVYLAKWKTKLIKVILRSKNGRSFSVSSPGSDSYWDVPELYYQKGKERKYTQCA